MILGLGQTGHAAYVTGNSHWRGQRAWTVWHANWPDPSHAGQTSLEGRGNIRFEQCTFVEYRPGKVKVLYPAEQNEEALTGTGYPLIGFIHQK